jgi:hypothetical protein
MDYSQAEMQTRFIETMKHFKFHKWIATEERGTKNKLLHLQCCLWHSDQRLDSTKIKSFRFNKQRLAKTGKNYKNKITQISFAASNKNTLATYSLKEFHKNKNTFIITNVTHKEMKIIPKWTDLKDEEKVFKDKVNKYCETIKQAHPWHFRNKIIELYKKNKKIPSVHTLRKLTVIYNIHYTASDLQMEIGSLRNTRFSEHSTERYQPETISDETLEEFTNEVL